MSYKIGILGVGKMGGAILNGLIKGGVYKKEDIILCLHSDSSIAYYGDYNYTLSQKELFINSETIIIAVKPQVLEEVCAPASDLDFTGKTVLSVAAGITVERLASLFKNAFIVRAMPNTPAAIGKGVITYCVSDEKAEEVAEKILGSIGKAYKIEQSEMDATLPLNGSMPAFLQLFAKAFIEKAVDDGIDRNLAKTLCCETIKSSAELILSSSEDIDTLIKNVSSKGGTTLAGLDKLYEGKFEQTIKACSEACKNRSEELAK